MLRTLFFHLFDAHSLCNRIKLCEPRAGSRAQNPQHVTRSHKFPTRLHLHCLVLLCAKPFGKRVVYDREKSSEMTKYSVPSFGGHIDFSDDVTIYPVLVMARTGYKHTQDRIGDLQSSLLSLFESMFLPLNA